MSHNIYGEFLLYKTFSSLTVSNFNDKLIFLVYTDLFIYKY